MFMSDVKRCAQQIVKESFRDIISGDFQVPTEREIEKYLTDFIEYAFDEYRATKKVTGAHPGWNEEMITAEVDRIKRRSDKEYRSNIISAANQTVQEIENLIKSLDDTIRRWKIIHLE